MACGRSRSMDDERATINGWLAELDRLAVDLRQVDASLASVGLGDDRVRRLMTITGINLTVAVGLVAAIGESARFTSSEKLVSYFGLNPRVRQSGNGRAHHGRITKHGRSLARGLLVEAAWAAAATPGPLHAFFVRIKVRRGQQSRRGCYRSQDRGSRLALADQGEDYAFARPALHQAKLRQMEIKAGMPVKARRQHSRASEGITISSPCETSSEKFVAQAEGPMFAL